MSSIVFRYVIVCMLERWTDASDLLPFADRHEPGPIRMPLEYVDTEARVARLYDDYVSIRAFQERESVYDLSRRGLKMLHEDRCVWLMLVYVCNLLRVQMATVLRDTSKVSRPYYKLLVADVHNHGRAACGSHPLLRNGFNSPLNTIPKRRASPYLPSYALVGYLQRWAAARLPSQDASRVASSCLHSKSLRLPCC